MADYTPSEDVSPNIGSFSNSYARLPAAFYASAIPARVPQPRLIKFNHALASELGLTPPADAIAAIFAGNLIPAGAEPLAMAYAGHQFGGFVPQLGDGRAILLGEMIDAHGQRRDIQLKGSGRTPFSRRGDGRAALGPVLREYLISEAMHALGIPTTRALAAVTTGEQILREEGLVPGAVFTRVAASHVRVGTFQYFAARGDQTSLRQLADYVINRHYPLAKNAERPYLALLQMVAEAQANLIAQWLRVGFIHGVMNTDNMAIAGQTIDFGPCAFMDAYDPATVFSSIDHYGRYAYANQPRLANWNLARFAEAILPLLDDNQEAAIALGTEVVEGFQAQYAAFWLETARAKLGLFTAEDGDEALMNGLLDIMHKNQADFTLTFRHLNDDARSQFVDPTAFDHWAQGWRSRLNREPQTAEERAAKMRTVNPAFIPRNHRVEQALQAAVQRADFTLFEEILTVLANPYQDQPEFTRYATPPELSERVLHTFCGT